MPWPLPPSGRLTPFCKIFVTGIMHGGGQFPHGWFLPGENLITGIVSSYAQLSKWQQATSLFEQAFKIGKTIP